MSALDRMRSELRACAVPLIVAELLCERYACALRTGAETDWIAFYECLYRAMLDVAERNAYRAEEWAAQSLLLILRDDLGQELFGERITTLSLAFDRRLEKHFGVSLPMESTA